MLYIIKNYPERCDLCLVIGPGPHQIRQKLYDLAQANPSVFKNRLNKLYKRWTTVYKTNLLTKKEIEDKELEDIKSTLKGKINSLKNSDFKEIQAVMSACSLQTKDSE